MDTHHMNKFSSLSTKSLMASGMLGSMSFTSSKSPPSHALNRPGAQWNGMWGQSGMECRLVTFGHTICTLMNNTTVLLLLSKSVEIVIELENSYCTLVMGHQKYSYQNTLILEK